GRLDGRTPDPRLAEIQKRSAGASEAVPSDGGFLVDPEFSRELVTRMYNTGMIYSRCLEMPCSTNGIKFPQIDETSRATGSRLGGVQVFTQNEGQALIATKPKFKRNELT